jgi:hypothetical protein
MNNAPHRYHAYLLRLWPEHTGRKGTGDWRATLEDARTGQRLGFASLEQLFSHLMQLAENGASGGDEPAPTEPEGQA